MLKFSLILVLLLATVCHCEDEEDGSVVEDLNQDPITVETIQEDIKEPAALEDLSDNNATTTVDLEQTPGDVNTEPPPVRPKRISCLRREHPKPADPDPDIEYEDGTDVRPVETSEGSALAKDLEEPGVKVVNSSYLMHILSEQHNPNVTNRTNPAECMLVFFYAKWCPFSCQAAKYVNALGRIYDDLPVLAIDSSKYTGVNTQFGILALPTILLFHNSKPVSKFNHTVFNLENYSQFILTLTGIEASGLLELTETDFTGPLPTVAEVEPDYNLYLAWIFTVVCGLFYFSKSSYCKRMIESVQNNWREVEIQHEHIE